MKTDEKSINSNLSPQAAVWTAKMAQSWIAEHSWDYTAGQQERFWKAMDQRKNVFVLAELIQSLFDQTDHTPSSWCESVEHGIELFLQECL
ncbi:MAG: hypothetical protein HUJ55_05190 [Ileibacterium sp.]|nr:hypothetical protein [Ileibacterium sp.]